MHDAEGGDFWSGYVAAMAGLVQSLMLLVVILACSIYLMSVLASRRVDVAVAVAQAEVVVDPTVDGRWDGGIQILYPTDVWALDEESRGRVQGEVAKSKRVEKSRWLLWAAADTGDAIKRRSAYLRLVSLRGELLGLGVTGPQIDVRIVHREGADGRNVYLVPRGGEHE